MELPELKELESPQIYRLPLEMICEIFSYVDKKTLLALRQASSICRDVIHFEKLCKFSSCTLSDSTARFVLTSEEIVDKIVIKNFDKASYLLPNRKSLPQNQSTLRGASEVIFGKGIHPQNLRIITELLGKGKVRTIRLDTQSKRVLDQIINSKITFRHLTVLDLFFGNRKYESNALQSLANQVEGTCQFPNLQTLDFCWNQSEVVNVIDNPLARIYLIYLSLHKIVWNHRDSLKTINWNLFLRFDDINGVNADDVLQLHNEAGIQEFFNYKNLMSQIFGLKSIQIGMINWEGHESWNLSEDLIKSQRELTQFSLKSVKETQEISVAMRLMEKVAEKNAKSLVKLEMFNGKNTHSYNIELFNLNWLINCHLMTDLRINYFKWELGTIIHTPLGLTNLSIGLYDSVRDKLIVDWILTNLKKLKSLDLLLGMSLWMNIAYFKSFITSLPELEGLELKSYGSSRATFKACKAVCSKRNGVIARINKNVAVYQYELTCKIDRNVFKGF